MKYSAIALKSFPSTSKDTSYRVPAGCSTLGINLVTHAGQSSMNDGINVVKTKGNWVYSAVGLK